MTFDLDTLLPIGELLKPRTPADLAAWVDQTCHAIAAVDEAREPALMHQRPFKEFYEEIYPLSLFVKHRYPDRENVLVTPNLDNRSFDATIYDPSVSIHPEIKVEITLARDPQEHLRMEYFVQHHHVTLSGPLFSTGNKKSRQIRVEPDVVAHSELLTHICAWIKAAAEGKADRPERYGASHILLIAFDDWFHPSAADMAILTTFVTEQVMLLSLNFSALYVIGLSGHTYLPFTLIASSEQGEPKAG